MGYQDEPPLSKRELKIIRGMIDDHEYRRMHEQERGQFWTSAKILIAALAALVTVGTQTITMVVLLSHG